MSRNEEDEGEEEEKEEEAAAGREKVELRNVTPVGDLV